MGAPSRLIVNIDVPDLAAGEAFYRRAFGLEPACRIATFADPFGHGFCLIQFTAEGYDAIAS